jgi:hypothetical protein
MFELMGGLFENTSSIQPVFASALALLEDCKNFSYDFPHMLFE